ncbi:hypothetical protein HanRHA438_Chr13g0601531 [Helianthus annuus]|uniref:Uncharacterized protein n=1 Tax=Helianthus annuus TaxID=4232 RepID=A0A251SSE5_HELAN|nr:hypothetical protein HanXRQr2_Chr13g0590781 [Helianthus annuus]KAJ0497936.1 hypothetical protein HanHA89_Chr13g0516701 [Helianthus annuus]KAJ0663942.1 hypothetical protein HanLR1_Chr13g0486591 [Helianthus annuus]KAJ0849454.1 hypothetical protein HanPSC8_Chr13g0568921 [Helianthus annuus]KAJ0858484.1 hypothetical protein HanRHA438_Chr13g0601531 [Helianthus annuus]
MEERVVLSVRPPTGGDGPLFCEHTCQGSKNPPPLLNDISFPPAPVYFSLRHHNRRTFTGKSIRSRFKEIG